MERFIQLFADFLSLVYHCFDRIVIHGYLSGLSRPEQVVYFFRHVLGIPVVSKEILSQRTNDYRGWVEAYARNHKIPIEWAEKGTRKENYVLPALRRMEKKNAYGVYIIFKSMEQGRTFRISVPKISDARSQPSHPGAPTKPLHALLLLYPGCSFGTHHHTHGDVLSVSCHLLAQRSLFHRTGADAKADWFPQERQCLPVGG